MDAQGEIPPPKNAAQLDRGVAFDQIFGAFDLESRGQHDESRSTKLRTVAARPAGA
jgi:hypothetical protein